MLDISPEEFDAALNRVSNSVLWFVHHLLFDTPNQPRFGTEFRRDWTSYLAYNFRTPGWEPLILSERGCALVLSREAGAAELIGARALLVNPYDVTATA